jgi:Mrp family chromosome partitioning ATPase
MYKFKHTITDLNFARAPEATQLRAVPSPDAMLGPEGARVADHTIRLPPQTQRMIPPEPEQSDEVEVPAEVLPKPDGHGQTLFLPRTESAIVRSAPPPPSFVFEQVEIPVDVDARLVMLYGHASEQARAFRLLRHRLLSHGDPRVLAVTSAEPNEGKTTCAANLALGLADETMSRVLLVEANLRRPALGEVFGYEPGDSFVRHLVEHRDASPPYPVAGVVGTRLHIAALPSQKGRRTRLDRLLFSTALHELRTAYDYIVIDAAAVLESADADVAGECADGVILATRTGVSKKSAVQRAVEQLHPTRVFGTVLLDV